MSKAVSIDRDFPMDFELRHAVGAAAVLASIAFPSFATACWSDAERLYGVSSHLLFAVARAESDLKADAVNLTHLKRTGTYDIGLMQINSSHLLKLARHGISESDLLEPCTNIKVGAWLLADSFARHGVSWNAVGAYNAACTQLKGNACMAARARYAWRVFKRLPSAIQASAVKQTVRPASATGPVPGPSSESVSVMP